MSPLVYPLRALRSLALHAQGLARANRLDSPVGPAEIHRLVQRLGLVQIDTLHMVRRAQYLTLWSRLGVYNPADFDCLAYDPAQRVLFEYWGHAATYIPLENYRYYLPAMQRRAEHKDTQRWLNLPGNAELAQQVHARVAQEGALRAADFEDPRPRGGLWWDWKPAKIALEHLYNSGELMISSRHNFQRIYDLRQRVLPAWVDTRLPSLEECQQHFVRLGTQALGVFRPEQAGDYTYANRTVARPIVKKLLEQGELVEVQGETLPGGSAAWLLRREMLPLLEQAADGALRAERTCFLNPFDSLFWARDRDEQLWGFEQTIEAYVPAPKRRWGYFCLPILHHDRLVGRFDPKLERKTGRLILRALHLEPGVTVDEALVQDMAAALHDFMRFHQAQELVIEKSNPAEFSNKLLAAL